MPPQDPRERRGGGLLKVLKVVNNYVKTFPNFQPSPLPKSYESGTILLEHLVFPKELIQKVGVKYIQQCKNMTMSSFFKI